MTSKHLTYSQAEQLEVNQALKRAGFTMEEDGGGRYYNFRGENITCATSRDNGGSWDWAISYGEPITVQWHDTGDDRTFASVGAMITALGLPTL